MVFFPTVDRHFSLNLSRVLDVEVKEARLNFFLVIRTSLDVYPPLASLYEFFRSLESEKRPNIFASFAFFCVLFVYYSFTLTLLVISAW